jgi:PPK2 family polyphosphate:nucleotide phosphotransferase
MDISSFRVPEGARFRLAKIDPDSLPGFSGTKEEGKARLAKAVARIEELQEILYAQGKHRVLVVFQAMDAGGKDGTIRVVFDGVNPQGVRVASFKKPTEPELAHDYLWRVHAHVPANGELVIFNRSHYEDVLVVRVRGLVPKATWKRRYQHIRDFERMLTEEGTTIVKFFLHISADEQAKRIQERIDTPSKQWKFSAADLDERKLWPDYQAAFEAAIGETSTRAAPWYVIPANRNWFRNLVVAEVMVKTLEGLKLAYPKPVENLDAIEVV